MTERSLDRREARSQLSTADAAEALSARTIDAFFTTGGRPDPTVAALAQRLPIRVAVRWDLPEEVAYWATKLLFAAKPEMVRAHIEARRIDPRSAVSTAPMPLHPGAQRYYRETKPMA